MQLPALVLLAALATAGCEPDAEVITVALVEISVPPGPFRVGATAQFSATAKDRTGQIIADRPTSWSTSDATIASIDASGLLRALRAGQVTVQATIDGRSSAVAIAIITVAPRITSITPGELRFGESILTLTIEGTDFVTGSVVRFNGQARPTTFVSATRLGTTLTADDSFNPGVHSITVLNPEAGSVESGAFAFTVNIPVRGPFLVSRAEYSCGINASGEALCWGRNPFGQLGDNTTTDRTVPTRVSTSLRFVAIGVGDSHTCALVASGVAHCWGTNSRGELGDGSLSGRTAPVAVTGGKFFLSIAVGNDFTCGLDGQGRAWCWGSNTSGQLGDGSNTSRSVPTAVAGNLVFRALSAGDGHVCGVTTTNEVYCWGANANGSLGTGDTSARNAPARVVTPAPIATVSAGYTHTCAVANNGNAYCWGHNGTGALGTGQRGPNSSVAVQVMGSGYASIAAGRFYTCALLISGLAQCWGDNDFGQLGNGSRTDQEAPTAVQGGFVFRALTAGMRTTCGLTLQGAAWCWGSRGFGEMGDGTSAYRLTPAANFAFSGTISGIESSLFFSCAMVGGAPYCWGLNDRGQLGNGTTTNAASPTQVPGRGTLNAEVTIGASHVCLRTTTGSLSCWGDGTSGQLGVNSTGIRLTPVLVSGGLSYRSVSAGAEHTCAVTVAGQLYCWGSNFAGQLGTGNTTSSNVPIAVTGVAGLTFVDVTAANFHTCARTTAGGLYCWGLNDSYQLGDGTSTNRNVPVPINVGATVASVTASRSHTCVLTTTGVAYCWGTNSFGELGTGSTTAVEPLPKLVQSGLTFASLRAGSAQTCGVTTAGVGYCWGLNLFGNLGIGTLGDSRAVPAQITSAIVPGASFAMIDPGYQHTCGITTNGRIGCWGLDTWGELGLGAPGTVPAPRELTGVVFMIR